MPPVFGVSSVFSKSVSLPPLALAVLTAALAGCASQPPATVGNTATPRLAAPPPSSSATLRMSPELRSSAPARRSSAAIAPASATAETAPALPSHDHALFFAAGSATPNADGRRLIQSLAQRLKENRLTTITLIGHSDDSGSTEFDIALAQRRVDATADEFERAGVLPRQIRRISYGNEAQRGGRCTNEACRQQERRVDLRIDG